MSLTIEQIEKLMQFLILSGVKKEEVLQITTAMETQEALLLYLDRLSEMNFDATPQELYQIAGEVMSQSNQM